MKSHSDKITLLVVGDAEHPVRQLQLAKPLAIALPAAAVLSVSSLVTSMYVHSSRSMQELEAEAAALSERNIRLEAQAADRETTLRQVQTEAAKLSQEADTVRERLKSVDALEQKLQDMIKKQGASTGKESSAAKSSKSSATAAAKNETVVRKSVESTKASAYIAPFAAFSRSSGTSGSSVRENPEDNPMETSSALAAAQASSAAQASAAGTGDAVPAGLKPVPKPSAAAGVQQNADDVQNALFVQPSQSVSPSAITIRIGLLETAIDHTPLLRVGGEYVAVHRAPEALAVSETKDELAELGSQLEEMITSLNRTVQEAQEANAARMEQALREQAKAFLWPTSSRTISSSFGYRTDPFKGTAAYHGGIDIAAQTGDFVFAAQAGTVITADQTAARGNYIVIDHGDGIQTWYMHLSAENVSPGDKVAKGQRIGEVGSTGRSTGPHLHFQVVKQDKLVDPLSYVHPE
ncbi:peptidoglycan DD-metalloendopeptidase family protein [Paenibacillus stellifer]|uniref:peptidoglycan DD-metalloendopeptidase family protein n=1 Tax=Paenibacillus stellifer TaxID=169760 RepID=UPI00068A22CC|nr:peptidoglycan DD-metalloendopeptidase family protein [Paenibacillus stellifer]